TMKLLLLALFLLLAAATAEAATYWVSKSSDGNQHCFNSATQPGNLATQSSGTITQGIQCMAPTDTLYILSGTYAESIGGVRQAGNNCPVGNCIPNGVSMSQMSTVSAAPGHERLVKVIGGGPSPIVLGGYMSYIKIYGIDFDGQRNVAHTHDMFCASDNPSCNLPPSPPNFPNHIHYENNIFQDALVDC